MQTYSSWARPWLDDPGPWDTWELDDTEKADLEALFQGAAKSAECTLRRRYGKQADLFGAAESIRQLADAPFAHSPIVVESLFRMALAITVFDYYCSRVPVPRVQPGGTTNPANRKRWADLRPYLLTRLRLLIAENTPGSLLTRACYVSISGERTSAKQLEHRIERQFRESGMFENVAARVELKVPTAGGPALMHAETRKTIESAKVALAKRTPLLVEVVRDPGAMSTTMQVAVIFRVTEIDDGRLYVDYYAPASASEPMRLDIRLTADSVSMYDAGDNERQTPKGLRCVELAAATPPMFGIRRYTRRWLPWRLFWWLTRRWRIVANRRKERTLQVRTRPAANT